MTSPTHSAQYSHVEQWTGDLQPSDGAYDEDESSLVFLKNAYYRCLDVFELMASVTRIAKDVDDIAISHISEKDKRQLRHGQSGLFLWGDGLVHGNYIYDLEISPILKSAVLRILCRIYLIVWRSE